MRRLTVLAGAGCAALLISLGAVAQVPPDPNNPNEAVPEEMVQPEYGQPINLETAKKVAAAAAAEATKRNWRGLCISVVGPSGDLIYFERSDNCQFGSISISQQGARGRTLSSPDSGVRKIARQGALLFVSGNPR